MDVTLTDPGSLLEINQTYFLYSLHIMSDRILLFYPEILQYYTMILQRIRIIAVDAGFEPGISAPEVWRATNETPHLQKSHHIYMKFIQNKSLKQISQAIVTYF